MGSLSVDKSSVELPDRLLTSCGKDATNVTAVQPAMQASLFGVEKYGLALLTEVAFAAALVGGNGPRQSRCSALVFCSAYERLRYCRAGNDAAHSAAARRSLQRSARPNEIMRAALERIDPAKGPSFHPTARDPTTSTAACHPSSLHHDGLRWLKWSGERCERKKREKEVAATAGEVEDVSRCRPWRRLSPGTRRVLQVPGAGGRASLFDVDATDGNSDESRFGTSPSNAATQHHVTKKSRHLTMHHASLVKHMQDDVAVRRERGEHAWNKSSALQLTHAEMAEQVKRLHCGRAPHRGRINDGDPTFRPKVNGRILSHPDKPRGTIVAVPSSFCQERTRTRQEEPQCGEKQKRVGAKHGEARSPLLSREGLPDETRRTADANSPGRLESFFERQRLWEAKRAANIRRFSDEVNSQREVDDTAGCSFRPAINPPRFWRPPPVTEKPRASSTFVPSTFVEQKSPTHTSVRHYSDINDLRIRRRHSVKRPTSPNGVPRGGGSGKTPASAGGVSPTRSFKRAASYTELHGLHSATQKVFMGRCRACRWPSSSSSSRHVSVCCNSGSPRRHVTVRSPPVREYAQLPLYTRGAMSDLDEDTLLDLSLWWKSLVMEEFQVPLGSEANDNACVCTDLHGRVLETPFAQTLSAATVMRALQELAQLCANGPRGSVGRHHIHTNSLPGGSDGVTFAQFIELYSELCFKIHGV